MARMNKKQFDRKSAYFLFDGDCIRNSHIVAFQSYSTVIWVYSADTKTLYLSPYARSWSRTTSKHLSQSLSHMHAALGLGYAVNWYDYQITCAETPENMRYFGYGCADAVRYNNGLILDCEIITPSAE